MKQEHSINLIDTAHQLNSEIDKLKISETNPTITYNEKLSNLGEIKTIAYDAEFSLLSPTIPEVTIVYGLGNTILRVFAI